MSVIHQIPRLPKKIAKALFHLRLQRFTRGESPRLPTHIQIEPTVRCNLRCVTCSRESVIGSYKQRDMTLEQFDRILSMFPRLSSVKLQGLGEPLLHPQIEELLARCKARGARIWVTTNGTLFNQPRFRDVALEYVDDLAISIDSTNPLEFGRIRRGADLDAIVKGVRELVRERARRRGRTAIGINCVESPMNHHELAKIADLSIDLHLDYVSIVAVENWTIKGENGFEESDRFVKDARAGEKAARPLIRAAMMRLARSGLLPGYKDSRRRLGRCFWPFKSVFISVEGFVTPCCIRMHARHALGNIFDAISFADIWQRENYRALRRDHIERNGANEMCGTCPD